MRVALLTNIPSPYRLPFFRELSLRCELKVLFDSRAEPNRQWNVPDDLGFTHAYMPGFAIPHMRQRPDGGPNDLRYWQVRFGLLPSLLGYRPEVVVSAEFGLRSMQAAAYCAAARIPLILWSEGTPHSEGWQSALRRAIRRGLVKRARGFWSNGVESTQLLESYGASVQSTCEGMIGVSTFSLAEQVQAQLAHRPQIRTELNLRGTVLLFSGQLIPRKGVKEFLAALLPLAPRVDEFSVIFLGEGLQRPMVEAWRAQHPEFHIATLGFRQPDFVPRIYAAADIFVLPTLDDNWSLVALEAAVAGLPQVFSRYNGATRDLLDRQAPGIVVDPLDTNAFAAALGQCLDTKPGRVAAQITASLIEYYSPAECANRAIHSLETALNRARPDQEALVHTVNSSQRDT